MSRQQTDGKLAGKSAARLYEVVKEIVDRLDPIGLLALGCLMTNTLQRSSVLLSGSPLQKPSP
jgi:hypothetical protein